MRLECIDGIHVNNALKTDHTHPTMTLGVPFKSRGGRISPGVLATPDIYKYKIPTPVAFVFPNTEKEARSMLEGKRSASPLRKTLLSAGDFKLTSDCQKQVINYNTCLKNHNSDSCNYYRNFLNSRCNN